MRNTKYRYAVRLDVKIPTGRNEVSLSNPDNILNGKNILAIEYLPSAVNTKLPADNSALASDAMAVQSTVTLFEGGGKTELYKDFPVVLLQRNQNDFNPFPIESKIAWNASKLRIADTAVNSGGTYSFIVYYYE
jgi:hypothetical protein